MKTLKDIHQDLSLSHPPDQDWGLVNGETGRTKDFIEYFNNNEQFIDKPTRLSYLDLVISSYNQNVLENKNIKHLYKPFKDYILKHNESFYDVIIGYWISIRDDDEFPVGYVIEEIIDQRKS